MLNLKILTACDENFKDIVKLNRPILKQYCLLHNYQIVEKSIVDFPKPPSWFKIDAMLVEMNSECSHVMWIDADTLILKQSFNIDSLLVPDKELYISRDINGINCGIMILQNTQFMRNILQKINSMSEKYLNHIWWEQAALMELIAEDYNQIANYIQYVPQRIINAYDKNLVSTLTDGYVSEDTFILHLPSSNNHTRLQTIKSYIKKYYDN
jgi:hypothetical protein